MPLISAPPSATAYTQIQNVSLQAFNILLSAFVSAMNKVWKAANPQAVIDLMGTDAKNNFLASSATAAYLVQFSELSFSADDHARNVAKISAAAALAQPYTVNADGTITVAPPAAPAPAQASVPAS